MACNPTIPYFVRPCENHMGGIRRVGIVRLGEMIKGSNSFKFYDDDPQYPYANNRCHLYLVPSKGFAAVETVEPQDSPVLVLETIKQDWEDYGGALIKQIAVPRQGTVLESSLTVNEETGVQLYRHQLTIPTRSLGNGAVRLLVSLAHVEDLIGFVETYGGKTLLMGWKDAPVKLSGVESTTGAAWGDAPGHNIILACESEYPLLPLALANNDNILFDFVPAVSEAFFAHL